MMVYENLVKLRKSLGFNQQDFAKELGLKKNTYSNYENGLRDPNTDLFIMIASKYNTTVDYLVGLTSDSQKYEKKSPVSICEAGGSIKDEIVEIYDELNSEGQNLMLEHAHYLGSQGKYKKLDQLRMGDEENTKQA